MITNPPEPEIALDKGAYEDKDTLDLVLQYLEQKQLNLTAAVLQKESGIVSAGLIPGPPRLPLLLGIAKNIEQKLIALATNRTNSASKELLKLAEIYGIDTSNIENSDDTLQMYSTVIEKPDINILLDLPRSLLPHFTPFEEKCLEYSLYSHFDPNSLRASSMKRIVIYMTSANVDPGNDFRFIVFASHKVFIKSEDLLDMILARYTLPEEVYNDTVLHLSIEEIAQEIKTRVVLAIQSWLNGHFTDFTDLMLRKLLSWIETEVIVENHLFAAHLKNLISKSQMPKKIKAIQSIAGGPSSPKVPICDIRAVDLANQLSVRDSEAFSALTRDELLSLAWMTHNPDETAPQLTKLTAHFNEVTSIVSSSIRACTTRKRRIDVISQWIRVASELLNMSNYHSFYAAVLGLQKVQSTFPHEFQKLSRNKTELYKEFLALTDSAGNFSNLRKSLNQATYNNMPVIPYTGMMQADAVFIEEANDSFITLNNLELPNFVKAKLLSLLWEQVSSYKSKKYQIMNNPAVMRWIEGQPKMVNKELMFRKINTE